MTPSDQPRPHSRGASITESVLLPAQKSRDVEMIVLGYRRTSNSPALRFVRAGGARRLRARLSAGRLGRSQNLGPLKLRPGRGDAVLRIAQRTQLVLGQLRQVLDLRHAGRTKDRLLRGGRNEFLVLRFVRFKAGIDWIGEGGDGRDGVLLAYERGRRVSLG